MNRLTVVTVALLGWLFAAPAFSADLSSPPVKSASPPEASAVLSKDELIRLTTLLTAVNRFKQISLDDYERALLVFATEDAIAKFRSFNQNIWVDTPPRTGWSYFMSSSVHAVGDAKRQQPLVAFYNPWSDVFLITEWRMDKDIPHLVDAEILMGDWLRPENVLNPVPDWLRTDTFKPAALGTSVARSIVAFEKLFQNADASSWRRQLPVLEDRQLLTQINYPVVALMLLRNLQNINEFRTLNKGAEAACRRMSLDVIRTGAQGQIGTIRKAAKDTLPGTWDVLESLAPEWFRTLEAVAVLKGKDGCLVFLSPVFDATGSLSLFFQGKKDKLNLQRVDVIDYSEFYKNLGDKGEATRRELSL